MFSVKVNEQEYRVEENKHSISINGNEINPDLIRIDEKLFHLIVNGRSYSAELESFSKEEKQLVLKINGNKYTVKIRDEHDQLLARLGMEDKMGSKVNEIKAPMPGLVLKVIAAEGQEIKKGDPLLVLEAMKMENVLKSAVDATISRVFVSSKDKVEKNQVLLTFN